MTSRASGFRHKYGVAGAGAVGKSLIGRLPGKARDIGPIACVSYRVASRIANTLRAGHAAREPGDLNTSRTILFHSPPDQIAGLAPVLLSDQIHWTGKSLVLCDCELPSDLLACLTERGASAASASEFGIAGYLAIQGTGPALTAAHRMARELRLKAIDIPPGAGTTFKAAITFATCAFTPLIDRVATLLRQAGVRETEAPRLAAALFQKTAADYIHSGKQSWGWYAQGPEADRIEQEITAAAEVAGENLGETLRQLILLGLETYDRHHDVAKAINASRPAMSLP
jgi:hypothetical protein